MLRLNSLGLLLLLLSIPSAPAQFHTPPASRGDELVSEYFAEQTRQLSKAALSDIESLAQWEARKETYRGQLLEMLGLDPYPSRTDLQPVITGTVEHDEFIVENLHFQSMPGLYVTGNLYRPKKQDNPLPAILYVCGHGGVRKDGVSYGNKTHYQHHGAWFARNGYVCLTIDTIQLGELEGLHHGTYREGMWWWNNRGYTPAGVEAWNCVRSLDYLQSRSEVDAERIGVTGRSGGGVYSWWIAAIDERIKVAVPVAGITTLENHVVDGCVEGHCDCMFMINTYRWDYPMVAALVAPRPLLISNSDKDRIFPLDGVVELHRKVRRIYELYDAGDKLGLHITEGPHKDTQELRIHAFRWFNRFLKDEDRLIDTVATKFFEPEQLKVFETLPEDERTTTIHESFVADASEVPLPRNRKEVRQAVKRWKPLLRERTFGGWPDDPETLDPEVVATEEGKPTVKLVHFTSQSPYRLPIYLVQRTKASPLSEQPNSLSVVVLDQAGWEKLAPALATVLPDAFPGVKADPTKWDAMQEPSAHPMTTAYVVPRGVGPTQWTQDERERTHIRRRFMLLGQTAAGMQIYDVKRAIEALRQMKEVNDERVDLQGRGDAAIWALYAALFSDGIHTLHLEQLPTRNREAPDLLNVSRFVELPHVALMAASQTRQLVLPHGWEPILGEHPLAGKRIRFATAKRE